KPVAKKEVPTGITAKTVLDNYIKAIGGEKAVASVKTISMLGSTTIPQAPSPLTFTNKVDSKGKIMVEIAMGPMSLMKQVVNEKGAYVVQQGQRKNIEGADLAEMKASATPFEELQLAKKTGLTVTGIETINGNDAYAIQNGKATLYYDTKSGLKLAEAKTVEQGGNKMTQMTNFGDYREVKGVKVPFNIIQNVGFELDIKMSEVKINEGVSDADFL
ncbi:MAG: insulinase family protein, partial [Flavobacteriaceae bacterium]|nr:insulinase family protein [Flavobacteriaceae bacterium]